MAVGAFWQAGAGIVELRQGFAAVCLFGLSACHGRLAAQTGQVNVLLTAGPTREPIDPVRFLTNRSSGKMGYALAEAFIHTGNHVLLISGPTELDVPDYVDFIQVHTAAEMQAAVAQHIGRMDIAVFVAAVADYTPVLMETQKIKKAGDTMTIELVRTPDILGSARGELNFQGTLVGFAAETENLEENARVKLAAKGCDLVIANDVSGTEHGFDSDKNEVLLVYPGHTDSLSSAPKIEIAHDLADAILHLHRAKQAD
jgi:phosphopantothenoylcysteine decarboxylase/phosphopantothenate--cysteine ligase